MDLDRDNTIEKIIKIIKKIEALGYFETKEDPRVVADSIGYEIRRSGVVEGRIDLYYKSKSGNSYIETYSKGKRVISVLPKTWRFIEDIEPSEDNFKNMEICHHNVGLCSVDLSKKTQHEVDMEVLLSEVMGGAYIGKMGFGDLGRSPDAQIREEMDWPGSKVDW